MRWAGFLMFSKNTQKRINVLGLRLYSMFGRFETEQGLGGLPARQSWAVAALYFLPHQSKMPPMRPPVSNAFSASRLGCHKTLAALGGGVALSRGGPMPNGSGMLPGPELLDRLRGNPSRVESMAASSSRPRSRRRGTVLPHRTGPPCGPGASWRKPTPAPNLSWPCHPPSHS
jgi:hypothetical protein